MVYTPKPGSPEHDAIMLLASWNADGVAPPKLPTEETQNRSHDHR
jgi:hypothetical protein